MYILYKEYTVYIITVYVSLSSTLNRLCAQDKEVAPGRYNSCIFFISLCEIVRSEEIDCNSEQNVRANGTVPTMDGWRE